MATSWYKIKTYGKVTGIVSVLAVALLFMFSNMQQVTVKFLWFEIWQVPTYAFIFLVANGGIAVFLICRRMGKAFRDMRQLRHESKAQQSLITEVKQQVQKDEASQTKQPEQQNGQNNP